MSPEQIKNLLRTIGISSGIILIVLIIGAAFLFYRNYLETERIKLQILLLQKSLNDPNGIVKPSPMDNGYRGITEIRTLERTAPVPQYAPNKYEKMKM